MSNIFLPFILTLIAGLSMGIGSLISFYFKNTKKTLVQMLSFAAGIMIYAGFKGILPEGIELLENELGNKGYAIGLFFFFFGMILTSGIEYLVHRADKENHDCNNISHNCCEENEDNHLTNLGLMSAIAISIHNLPEGLALFATGLKGIRLAIPLTIAIVIHNIPLSIAIAVPLYYSTGSKRKTCMYVLLVGLCQPLGALLGYLLFAKILNNLLFGVLLSMVAGTMIFVALDQLMPTAQKNDNHHIAIYGAILGMITMAISLNVF